VGVGSSGTFEYDATDWTDRNVTSPFVTSDRQLVYDSTRHRVVLRTCDPYAGCDHWEYDGQAWSQILDPGPAPFRRRSSLAFDAARGTLVLFGGQRLVGSDRVDLDDTWEYGASGWVQVATTGAVPPARQDTTLVFDAQRNKIVMIGGFQLNTFDGTAMNLTDTWEYDGTTWTELVTNVSPGGGAATFDTSSGNVLLAGTGTWALTFSTSQSRREACIADLDTDGDARAGCDDPDCSAFCTPSCLAWQPAAQCDATGPRCGDGICDAAREAAVCTIDCPR
jgi:hypothetical protein